MTKPLTYLRGHRMHLVLTRPLQCQRGQKLYRNLRSANQSNARENTKFIETWVDQTQPMPARRENAFQHVMTKPLPWQRGYNMYLNKCWPNSSHDSKDTKCISTCFDNKRQRGHKMYLYLCWQNPSHASDDTKFFSTCDDQTQPMPARKLEVSQPPSSMPARTVIPSQQELTKPLPYQRGNNIYLNSC